MEQPSVKKQILSDTAYGTLLCVLSDTLFSVAYVFVQFINKHAAFAADWKGDWMLCFKEWIAAAFALPIFLYLWHKGRAGLPSFKVILMLFIAAFFCEYIGIGHHFTSYQFIGMSLGLPVIRTITILGATIVGAILLREKVSPLKALTIAILVAAVFMFGFCKAPVPSKATPQEAPATVQTADDDVQVQPALVAVNVAEEKVSDTVVNEVKETEQAVKDSVKEAESKAPVPSKATPQEAPAAVQTADDDVQVQPALVAVNVAEEKVSDTVVNEVKETEQAVKDSVKEAESKAPVPMYFGHELPIDPFLFGFLCAFITGIGYAIYTLLLRVVMRKEDPVTKKPVPPVNIYFVVSTVFGFGGLCGLISMLGKGVQLSDMATVPVACWWFILGAGVLTFVAFFLKNLSYRYATASKAATLSVVQVLLQVLFGVLIFGEATTALFWGGAVLTITGIILASKTA